MAVFKYTTKSKEGKRKQGEVRADNIVLAKGLIEKNDMIIVGIQEVKKGTQFADRFIAELELSWEKLKNRVPLKVLVFFTRQLSTMFSAGLTLEKSVSNLAKEESNKTFKKTILKISNNVRKGSTLSVAMEKHRGVFTNLYIALVKAGEVSGGLQGTLDQLAIYLEKQEDTRRKVVSAMFYPLFILIFLMFALTVMLVGIIPRFTEIYSSMNAELPLPTLMLLGFSNTISENLVTAIFVIALVIIFVFLLTRTQRGKYFTDLIKLKIPIFGSLIKNSIYHKFCKTFGVLLGAGVPVLESTRLMEKIVENEIFAEAIQTAGEYIRDGFNISTALRHAEVFPSIMLQLVATGEETGELDRLLDNAAEFYSKQVDALVNRITSIIEPLLVILVGLVIAVVVVVTYLPIFGIGNTMMRSLG